uniref:HEAT repeat domain-containing protein n=1 Tax=Saccharothrix mutabilis TaxID=33921 RepID=UPI0031D6F29C
MLVDAPDAELDATLLRSFDLACADGDRARAELISRILAERDPDRDPVYTVQLRDGHANLRERAPRMAALLEWLNGEFPLGTEEWGFPRLRRLEPVRRYAEQLARAGLIARCAAAVGLGDTADPAALPVLATALRDPHRTVRATSAQAVRRLWAALRGEVDLEPVREPLVDLLRDPARSVRLEAARTLCVVGEVEPVRAARDRLSRWSRRDRQEMRAILSGEIPPLPKTWIGERPGG